MASEGRKHRRERYNKITNFRQKRRHYLYCYYITFLWPVNVLWGTISTALRQRLQQFRKIQNYILIISMLTSTPDI